MAREHSPARSLDDTHTIMNSEQNMGTHVRGVYANRREPERMHSLAVMYWRVVLSVTACIVVLSIGYGAFQLFSVLGGMGALGLNAAAAQPAPILDQARLEDTLVSFHARENRFEALRTNALVIPDPSD